MADTVNASEIILYDDENKPVFPRTVLSSITTDDGAKSLAKYIEDLIATAKSEAIAEATTLANNAQAAAINQVKSDLGYSSDANKVTFSKAIASDSSVEDAVWN